MGHSLENLENNIGDFVENAMYHAKGYMKYSKQDRRKQSFAHRLRKDRARQRSEERERRERRRHGLPDVPFLQKTTEVSTHIAGMKAPLKPRAAIAKRYTDNITHKWRRFLMEDTFLRDLIVQEKNGETLGGPQLLQEDLKESLDGLRLNEEDIHPIFSNLNLERCLLESELSIPAVRRTTLSMRPALALATKFLTAPELQSWWYHLIYGVPATDRSTRKSYLRASPLEEDIPTARTEFAAVLEALSRRIQFCWTTGALRDGTGFDGIHSSFGFWDMLGNFIDTSKMDLRTARKRADGYNGFIGISTRFLYHLLSPTSPARSDLQADTRLQVQLAVTLTHELAHAVYAFRNQPFANYQYPSGELHIFDTDVVNEAGASWENHIWDGVILNCSVDRDGISDMVARTWGMEVLPSPWALTYVPDAWLRDLFRDTTWGDVSGHMAKLERPMGRPNKFVAERWVRGRGFESVWYVGGRATGEFADEFKGEGKIRGGVERWFEGRREEDMAVAVGMGAFEYEVRRGARDVVLGRGVVGRREEEGSEEVGGEEEENGLTGQWWY